MDVTDISRAAVSRTAPPSRAPGAAAGAAANGGQQDVSAPAPARPSSVAAPAFVVDIPRQTIEIIRLGARLLSSAADLPEVRGLAERILAQSGQADGVARDAPSGRAGPVSVPADLLRDMLGALATASRDLGRGESRPVRIPAEALRELAGAIRAAGGDQALAAQAEIAASGARNATVEVSTAFLARMAGEIGRVGAQALAAAAAGHPERVAPELAAVLRNALRAAEALLERRPEPGTTQSSVQTPSSGPSAIAAQAAERLAELRLVLQALEQRMDASGADRAAAASTIRVSADLLRVIAAAAREAGAPLEIVRSIETAAARAKVPAARVEVDPQTLRVLFEQIGEAAARQLARNPSAPAVSLPTAVYTGIVASLTAAAESREPALSAAPGPIAQAAAAGQAPASFGLGPETAPVEARAALAAVRALADLLAALPARDSPGREAIARLLDGLGALAETHPLLAQQAALALQAAVSVRPRDMQGVFARSGDLVAQILSLARAAPGAADGSGARAHVSFLLQTLMEIPPEQLGRIQGILAQLRALGAKVEIRPAEGRAAGVAIFLALGDLKDPQAKPFALDLRPGPPGQPNAGDNAEALKQQKSHGEGAMSAADILKGARTEPSVGRGAEARAQEAPSPDSPRPQPHGAAQFEYRPELAAVLVFGPPADPQSGAPGRRAVKTEHLLLTYEPELTRAWQREQLRLKKQIGLESPDRPSHYRIARV